ncbi:hypothetical protein [Halogeometricum sp. CBA1124]|uniref:hypothetical protein n=1 Tax=Halogeometricum sp. CBA1124 TaxID=2668071 RepID=UPI0018D2188B|nr:hypothetical protein [Halogeometricum sp. CBA1124]
MRCGECDHEYSGDDQPNYCPGCGVDWRTKNLDGVGWPLTITVDPRVDLRNLMKMETGIESSDTLWSFSDDVDVITELEVNRDGIFEVMSAR